MANSFSHLIKQGDKSKEDTILLGESWNMRQHDSRVEQCRFPLRKTQLSVQFQRLGRK
jgi:hypothetical protein